MKHQNSFVAIPAVASNRSSAGYQSVLTGIIGSDVENETGVRRWVTLLLCSALVAVSTACSVSRSVGGIPIAPPPPTHGQVDVTMALTDSFDVLPHGKCAGRHLNEGMRDGATVEIRGMSDHRRYSLRHVSTATMSTHYVDDVFYLNADGSSRPYDDGKYCVAHFTFVPGTPDVQGYEIELPTMSSGVSKPTQPLESFWSDVRGGRGYGSFHLVVQTCPDANDPPEQPC